MLLISGAGTTVLSLYDLLLHLYPYDFRSEFRQEMLETYKEATSIAGATGKGALADLWLREVRDLAPVLLREHRYARRLTNPDTASALYASGSLDGHAQASGPGYQPARFLQGTGCELSVAGGFLGPDWRAGAGSAPASC